MDSKDIFSLALIVITYGFIISIIFFKVMQHENYEQPNKDEEFADIMAAIVVTDSRAELEALSEASISFKVKYNIPSDGKYAKDLLLALVKKRNELDNKAFISAEMCMN